MSAQRPSFKHPTLFYLLIIALFGPFLTISLFLAKSKQATHERSTLAHHDVKQSKKAFISSSRRFKQHKVDVSFNENKQRMLEPLKNGGIIVFFHNPKTGGTSIRDLMKKSPQIDFVTRQKKTIDQVYEYMNKWTTIRDGKIHFLEIHGASPGFIELLPMLDEWKRQAAIHNIPIFVFTMMRDPLDWLISCFNFFCVSIRKHTGCEAPGTTDGLLREAHPNPQSKWYCFMQTIMAVPNLDEVNMSTCTLVDLLPSMLKYMDWVGFVEQYDETLTVLQQVLPFNITSKFRQKNKTRQKSISRKVINETTTRYLQSLMSQDYDLYRVLQEEYRIEKMRLPDQRQQHNDAAEVATS